MSCAGGTPGRTILDRFKRLDPGLLGLRLKASVISLLVMLAGFAGRKYALFRNELAFYLEGFSSTPMCYAAALPPPKWSMLDALPSAIEALALIVIAGLVGVLVPRKWRVASPWASKAAARQTRQQLRERLLDEERFPDGVAQQLED